MRSKKFLIGGKIFKKVPKVEIPTPTKAEKPKKEKKWSK